mmetsp:Transcript_16470/g.57595  ORF Transcript_16470/g.57595 Transcript_16470/m.57595 type:complete len:495 (+) Transcript_16470:95-1579(+)
MRYEAALHLSAASKHQVLACRQRQGARQQLPELHPPEPTCTSAAVSASDCDRRSAATTHNHANVPPSSSLASFFLPSSSSDSPKYSFLSSADMHFSCIHQASGPNEENSVLLVLTLPNSFLLALFMHFQHISSKHPTYSPLGRFLPQYTPPLSTTLFSHLEQCAFSGSQPKRVSSLGSSGLAMPCNFSQFSLFLSTSDSSLLPLSLSFRLGLRLLLGGGDAWGACAGSRDEGAEKARPRLSAACWRSTIVGFLGMGGPSSSEESSSIGSSTADTSQAPVSATRTSVTFGSVASMTDWAKASSRSLCKGAGRSQIGQHQACFGGMLLIVWMYDSKSKHCKWSHIGPLVASEIRMRLVQQVSFMTGGSTLRSVSFLDTRSGLCAVTQANIRSRSNRFRSSSGICFACTFLIICRQTMSILPIGSMSTRPRAHCSDFFAVTAALTFIGSPARSPGARTMQLLMSRGPGGVWSSSSGFLSRTRRSSTNRDIPAGQLWH